MAHEELIRRIGYKFNNEAYLVTALTHRSATGENNERMEFLGDAILSYVISVELYRRFPQATEGELSRLRASLVKGDTLAKLANSISLGDFLAMGSGELKSGGYRRSSIQADAFEAIIGAIYLDGGMEEASGFVHRFLDNKLAACDPNKVLKDPKTRLQEYLQAKNAALPCYDVVETHGKAHNQTFKVSCQIEELSEPSYGEGSSRRKAEQAAASAMLEKLGL